MVETFETMFVFHSKSRYPTNPTGPPSRRQHQLHSTLGICALSLGRAFDFRETFHEIREGTIRS
jgi:hypothetical protein